MEQQHKRSRHEMAWLTCGSKTCCSNSWVPVTGRDVYRIAATLGLSPALFTSYAEVLASRPFGFALDKTPLRHNLYLSKRLTQAGETPRQDLPCIFLMHLPNGRALCGLDALRPMICHTYPYTLDEEGLLKPMNGGCSCRDWQLSDTDRLHELGLQAKKQAEEDEYEQVVAEWNRRVAAYPTDHKHSFESYLDYLITAYARMAEK